MELNEVNRIIEDMSELQKRIVLLLKASKGEPVKGDTWFQKELFLFSKNVPAIFEEASFGSDMYGPFSENAKEQLEDLERDDVVSKVGKKMFLSDLGHKIADKLEKEVPEEELKMISEFKSLLNDLNIDEVLTFIYFTFPKYTEESLVLERIRNNRKSVAIKLYKKDKISLQRAAEIAGIPLEIFVKELD